MTRARWSNIASAVAVVLVVVLDRRSMIGAVVVSGFMAFVPGSALLRLFGLSQAGASGWVVTIGASLSTDVIVTEAMVYAHVWTPARGLIVLCLLTVALVGAEFVVSARRARHDALREHNLDAESGQSVWRNRSRRACYVRPAHVDRDEGDEIATWRECHHLPPEAHS